MAAITTDTEILDRLKERGLRMTPQRRAIVAEIMRSKGHISPADITHRVQSQMPGVNASTVYRTLTLLEDVGILSHAHLEDGPEYHRSEEAEHVHLICAHCGRDDALTDDAADALATFIRTQRGFEPDLTHFAISGLCARCQSKSTRSPA